MLFIDIHLRVVACSSARPPLCRDRGRSPWPSPWSYATLGPRTRMTDYRGSRYCWTSSCGTPYSPSVAETHNHYEIIIIITIHNNSRNTTNTTFYLYNSGTLPRSRVCTHIYIYTIICLKYVCRRSQTAGRNSCSIASGDVSNWSNPPKVHPVTNSRLSSA